MSEVNTTQPNRNKTDRSPLTSLNESRALPELLLLREKLRDENELGLLAKISKCQEPLVLKCLTCGSKKTTTQWCKRKWCPCCCRRQAGQRSAELTYIVERFKWPLFVTLTMRHGSTPSPADIRTIKRAFGKLRHRKFWSRIVKAGVAAVEITNEDGGWHPHLHLVLDCRWLSVKTGPPRSRESAPEIKARCKVAASEVGTIWAKILDQPLASIRIKRAQRGTIAKEVVKYTVKTDDLLKADAQIGDLIRCVDLTRMMTTFGRAHGQCVKDIRQLAKADALAKRLAAREEMGSTDCCPSPDMIIEEFDTSRETMLALKRRVKIPALTA